jgi:hypothetical protein
MASSCDLALLPCTSNANKPHLLSMPSEIRQAILKFACHGTINIRFHWKRFEKSMHFTSYITHGCSILQVCKQIRNEAHPILFDHISLHIDDSYTAYWAYYVKAVMSQFSLASYLFGSTTDFLEKACHSVKKVTLTFDRPLVCNTSLETSLIMKRLPALREIYLGNLTPWTRACGVAHISEIRDISTKSGMSDRWAGCHVLRCRINYFLFLENMLLSTDRRFKLTFDVNLVDSNEEHTAVRRPMSFCSP